MRALRWADSGHGTGSWYGGSDNTDDFESTGVVLINPWLFTQPS